MRKWIVIAAVATLLVGVGLAVRYERTLSGDFRAAVRSAMEVDLDAQGSDAAIDQQMATAASLARTAADHGVLQHYYAAKAIGEGLQTEERRDSEGDVKYFNEHKVLYDSTPEGAARLERRRLQMLAARREINDVRAAVGLSRLNPLFGEPGFKP